MEPLTAFAFFAGDGWGSCSVSRLLPLLVLLALDFFDEDGVTTKIPGDVLMTKGFFTGVVSRSLSPRPVGVTLLPFGLDVDGAYQKIKQN